MSEPEGGNPCFGCGDANARGRGRFVVVDWDRLAQRAVGNKEN